MAAFASQNSCTKEFSLELKTTLVIRWGWLRAGAAGAGSCMLNLGAFHHQGIKHLLGKSSTKWRGPKTQRKEL